MASASVWLDRLGVPPREVCLDWAWQIQSQFENIACSVEKETTALLWQRINVSDTGELLLPDDLQNYSPDERLRELLNWARNDSASLSNSKCHTTDRGDIESSLRELTNHCVAGIVPECVRPVPSLQAADLQESETLQTVDTLGLFDSKPSRSRNRVAGSSTNRSKQIIEALRQRWFIASAALVILIVACFIALNALTPSQSTVEAKPREETAIKNSPEKNSLESDETEAIASLTEVPSFGATESQTHEVPQLTAPNLATLAGFDSLGSETSGPVNDGTNRTGDTLGVDTPPNDSAPQSHREKESANSALTDRDVMQEVKTLTETAANSPVESEVVTRNSEESSAISEPLMLRTSPMLQTQKLAAKINVRPRQPVWQIQLSVDDEFELTPKEPQDTTDKQITTWLLSNSDSKSPKVRLVVQAQAASGRQTALRWRIFAGAEDLPDLMLPLDKELLQSIQERLRIYIPLAQRETERLKQLASNAEREMRTALSRQRASLESQTKLSSRLSTIVAEAQLLDDLLRNQLTIYAQLHDAASPNSAALLQFGDPRELEKEPELADPAE